MTTEQIEASVQRLNALWSDATSWTGKLTIEQTDRIKRFLQENKHLDQDQKYRFLEGKLKNGTDGY